MPDFQTYEILCVEHGNTFLYAEVIQTVSARQFCWVRPLILKIVSVNFLDQQEQTMQQFLFYDLRQGADLLLPDCLFRAALDTEVIPLLGWLRDLKTQPGSDKLAHQQLQSFIWQLWEAHPDVFLT